MILTKSLMIPQPKVLWPHSTTFPKDYLQRPGINFPLIRVPRAPLQPHCSPAPVAGGELRRAFLQDFQGLSDAKTELAPHPPSEVLRDLPDSEVLFSRCDGLME